MYWSGCQSTGAEMRKYLTAGIVSAGAAGAGGGWRQGQRHQRTVVDLLQGDDAVGRQALLGVLVEQKRLWGDRARLGRGHLGVVLRGIHGGLQADAVCGVVVVRVRGSDTRGPEAG